MEEVEPTDGLRARSTGHGGCQRGNKGMRGKVGHNDDLLLVGMVSSSGGGGRRGCVVFSRVSTQVSDEFSVAGKVDAPGALRFVV